MTTLQYASSACARSHAAFQSTLWSQVRQAGHEDGTRALEALCRVYWPPIHAFLRRSGFDPEQAEDLTQGFFATRRPIHCPAARFPSYALRPTYQFPLFSLAMNSQLIRTGPSVRFSIIEERDPARTALFLDNLLEGETPVHPAQETTHLGQPGAYANRFGPRHDRGGNIAFADGHVGWFAGRDVVETRDDSPLLGGPILPPREIVWEVRAY